MRLYTDLVIEASASHRSKSNIKPFHNVDASKVVVTAKDSRLSLQKPGKYITLFINSAPTQIDLESALKYAILELLDFLDIKTNKVLVIGLGNADYVVDSIGNEVIKKIKVKQNKLCAFSPKTNIKTGILSTSIIKAITNEISPSFVIVVDSIATFSKDKLCNCFQLTTAGIAPGGGIKNRQPFIDSSFLGVPLISIGFPVILSAKDNSYSTPYNIEDYIKKSSLIIANAINDLF